MSVMQIVRGAWSRRQAFHRNCEAVDCYRILHGYDEGLKGITVDRYGSFAIVNRKLDVGISSSQLVDALLACHLFAGIVMKSHQRLDMPAAERVRLVHGQGWPIELVVRENSRRFLADAASLHTNGLYLDARQARTWIVAHARNRRVLNMFAHTGSLGLCAALGGAKQVIHLDKSRAVLAKIRRNYELNGLTISERNLMHGDLYYHLPRAVRSGHKFGAIILDPPPRVPPPPRAPKHRPRGQDFAHLLQLCCQLLERGAWLLCLYHNHTLSHAEHDQFIVDAAQGTLELIWQGASDDDFPEADPNQKTRFSAFCYRGTAWDC